MCDNHSVSWPGRNLFILSMLPSHNKVKQEDKKRLKNTKTNTNIPRTGFLSKMPILSKNLNAF